MNYGKRVTCTQMDPWGSSNKNCQPNSHHDAMFVWIWQIHWKRMPKQDFSYVSLLILQWNFTANEASVLNPCLFLINMSVKFDAISYIRKLLSFSSEAEGFIWTKLFKEIIDIIIIFFFIKEEEEQQVCSWVRGNLPNCKASITK